MKNREESTKGKIISAVIIVVLVVLWLLALFFGPTQAVKVPTEITRSAVPTPLVVPRTPVPSVHVQTPTPEHKETKICVTATGVPAYWKVGVVTREWNLADHYADFVLSDRCDDIQNPQLTIALGDLPSDTIAETRFGSSCCIINLVLNRTVKSPWVAQSTMCHELGHVLGLPHISGTVNTCMTPVDAFYRTRPSNLDTRLVNSYGAWGFDKMYELSGKDIDARSLPR